MPTARFQTLKIAITVLGVLFAIPSITRASCEPISLEQKRDQANVIVTGEVFSIVEDEAGGQAVYLDPLTVFKGTVEDTIVIADPNGKEVTSVDLDFSDESVAYLLFLKSQDDGTFTTTMCMGSHALAGELSQEERRVLGEGKPFTLETTTDVTGTEAELAAEPEASAEPAPTSAQTDLERLTDWVERYRVWVGLALAWAMIWKGLALWYAARQRQRAWFIALLLVNTLGILEIIYLFLFGLPSARFAKKEPLQ